VRLSYTRLARRVKGASRGLTVDARAVAGLTTATLELETACIRWPDARTVAAAWRAVVLPPRRSATIAVSELNAALWAW